MTIVDPGIKDPPLAITGGEEFIGRGTSVDRQAALSFTNPQLT